MFGSEVHNTKQRLWPYLVLLAAFTAIPLFYHSSSYWLSIFVVVMYNIVGSVSLRTIGLSGNISFAHGSFIAIGAYVAGVLAKVVGISPYLSIPAGAVAAMIIGVATGFPFVRLRSIYYCMASLFLGVAIVYIIEALKVTGGYRGLTRIPSLFGGNTIKNYYFFLGITVLSLLAMYRFEFSRIGKTLQCLAQSPEAASAIGISERYYRLLAVGVGCFFAGLIGGAYAHFSAVLSPTNYGMTFTFNLMMYMMIGGEHDFLGPILGAIILVLIPEYARFLQAYAPFLTAGVMLLVGYLLPSGLLSIPWLMKKPNTKTLETIAGKEDMHHGTA